MTVTSLDIAQVDFLDVEAIEGSGASILALADKERMFMGVVSSPATRPIVQAAREWISGVEGHIDQLPDGDKLKALEGYDLIHRVAYRTSASPTFINRHVLAAFDAYIHGDLSIDECRLFRWIQDGVVCRRDKAFCGRPIMWLSYIIEEWIDLTRFGRLGEMPLDKAVHVATALLNSDLLAYIPRQNDYKYWLAHHVMAMTSDLESLNTPTLLALMEFNTALRPLGIDFPALGRMEETTDGRIVTEPRLRNILCCRPDLNPYYRDALIF